MVFCGIVVKRTNDDINRHRDKIEELEYMIADLRVENERSKREIGDIFVTKTDFDKFETEVFKRFDKFEAKLDHMINRENNNFE